MTTPTIPHFAHPFRVGGGGSVEALEQDTLDEITQNVSVILMTVRGDRLESPEFGTPSELFTVDLNRQRTAMIAAVERWEPRADVLITSNPDLFDELIRVVRVFIDQVSGDVI